MMYGLIEEMGTIGISYGMASVGGIIWGLVVEMRENCGMIVGFLTLISRD
jgi:hypothetical protein